MTTRRAKTVYRPLDGWPYPRTSQRVTPFSAPWSSTVDLLLAEADHLHAKLVVIELDVPPRAVRLDEQLRSDACVQSEKVRISIQTRRGALSWHTDLYRLPSRGGLGWRENVRAIALTLQALRAVDRYGAVHTAEQYTGFLALPPAPAAGFGTADEALRWLLSAAGHDDPRAAYRILARAHHPDAGGDLAEWARLDEARQLLEEAELL